jgi:hypothetical protein
MDPAYEFSIKLNMMDSVIKETKKTKKEILNQLLNIKFEIKQNIKKAVTEVSSKFIFAVI